MRNSVLCFVLTTFVFQLHINLLLSKKIYYTSTILELDITYTYFYSLLSIHNDYSWLHHSTVIYSTVIYITVLWLHHY